MAELNKEKLIGYLEHAIKLEGNMVTQHEITKTFIETQDLKKPIYTPLDEPSMPALINKKHNFGVAYVCSALPLTLGIFIMVSAANDKTFGIILLLVGFLIIAIPQCIIKSRESKENDRRMAQYDDACRRIRDQNRSRQEATGRMVLQWQQSKDNGLGYLSEKENRMQSIINGYYAPGYIYPKYRTLPALTSIYEYLTSGRCDELTGPNGAYNLYEVELRQNTIINQLNTIIENLEQIRNNQYTLYQEMTRITANTRRITAQLETISANTYDLTRLTALNAFYNSVTAENSGATRYIYSI